MILVFWHIYVTALLPLSSLLIPLPQFMTKERLLEHWDLWVLSHSVLLHPFKKLIIYTIAVCFL